MTTLPSTDVSQIVTNGVSIVNSIFRIAKSDSWMRTECLAAEKRTEIECARIDAKAEMKKSEMKFYYRNALAVLESEDMSSSQKRDVLIYIIDSLQRV